MKQQRLNGFKPKLSQNFGGSLLKKSHAKTKRPLAAKKPVHVILRSDHAKGRLSFLNNQTKLKQLINKKAKDIGIRIYAYANSGNHLHLLIYLKAKNNIQAKTKWNKFIRSITGLIARLITGAEKGQKLSTKFWTHKPFTRIVSSWVNDFRIVKNYIFQNTLEALGIIPYQSRKTRYPSRKTPFLTG